MVTDMIWLFGFPGAGSGPNVFRIWPDPLSEAIRFHPISGGSRMRRSDQYCRTMKEAAKEAANEILALAGKEDDLYFFGHCMGAITAYETALVLNQEHAISIRGLFVSASASPDVPIENGIAGWSDEAFAQEIRNHGTFPEEFFVNPAILKLFLPKIRADYRRIEDYCDQDHVRLDCPITGFFVTEDEDVRPQDTDGWANYTNDTFRRIWFPGGHYYYYDHQPEYIEQIKAMITELQTGCPPSGQGKETEMEERIRKVLAEIVDDNADSESWGPDTDLINEIGIDSLQLTRILLKLEEELGTPIDYDALQFEDLESIRTLAAFLKRTAKPDEPTDQ